MSPDRIASVLPIPTGRWIRSPPMEVKRLLPIRCSEFGVEDFDRQERVDGW